MKYIVKYGYIRGAESYQKFEFRAGNLRQNCSFTEAGPDSQGNKEQAATDKSEADDIGGYISMC